MNSIFRVFVVAFIFGGLGGCGPRDAGKKFPLMKESMEWLKSYCLNDVKLMPLWRGQGVSMKFECAVGKSAYLSDLDTRFIERGFSFVANYKSTKTWCKDGIGFHITVENGMRVSSYYPSSSCEGGQ
ncbi:hypothetical protein P3G55_24115 [Leptospira sp. 96542]|nr:hypothetical protein [Leptospira sp. 96542]